MLIGEDFFKTFKPLTVKSFKDVLPFLKNYSSSEKPPRYFLTPTVLLSYNFFFSIYDDCLLLLKAEWISGNPVLYLLVPPMHVNHNVKVEKSLIDFVISNGINVKLCDEELVLYNLNKGVATEEEYIYTNEGFGNFSGKTHKPFRNVINRLERCNINVSIERNNFTTKTLNDALTVLEQWGQVQKKSVYRPRYRLKHLNDMVKVGLDVVLQVSYDSGIPFDYTLTENYSGNFVTLVNRYYVEHPVIKDMSVYEHILDLYYWSSFDNTNYLFNSGGIRNNKSLRQSKMNILPIDVLQVYKIGDSKPNSEQLKEVRVLMCQR